jgi:N-acetylglucosamine-6-phosphate deacetylase
MRFTHATLVLPDRLVPNASLLVENGVIAAVGPTSNTAALAVDLGGMFLAPGFVDLHVHGGDGADFMDGTAEAFRTVCRCHARHGTTSLTPTSSPAQRAVATRIKTFSSPLPKMPQHSLPSQR